MLHRYFKHLWKEMSPTGRRTFPLDLTRGASLGILTTLVQLFALYVAIRYYEASETQKSLIAGSWFIGLLLSIFYAAWAPLLRRNTLAASLPFFISAIGLTIAATSKSSIYHTFGAVAAGTCCGLPVPIMTGLYRSNYRAIVRGQVFGIAAILTSLTGIMAARLGSRLLDIDIEFYRYLYFGFALCAIVAGTAVFRMPSTDIRNQSEPNPFSCFGAIRDNPLFGYILLAWFIFGFSNLILMPQRIEYLAQEKYGFAFNTKLIGVIVVIIPEATRLLMIPIWARLFDRFNFIRLRMIMNLFLIGYFVLYYLVPELWAIVLGSICLGILFGGGAIAWSLWVTKFSPPDQTSRYMAVHTFLTGFRGSLAPFVGYYFAAHMGLKGAAIFSITLTAISVAMLFPVRHLGERNDRRQSDQGQVLL